MGRRRFSRLRRRGPAKEKTIAAAEKSDSAGRGMMMHDFGAWVVPDADKNERFSKQELEREKNSIAGGDFPIHFSYQDFVLSGKIWL